MGATVGLILPLEKIVTCIVALRIITDGCVPFSRPLFNTAYGKQLSPLKWGSPCGEGVQWNHSVRYMVMHLLDGGRKIQREARSIVLRANLVPIMI